MWPPQISLKSLFIISAAAAVNLACARVEPLSLGLSVPATLILLSFFDEFPEIMAALLILLTVGVLIAQWFG